MLNSMTGFGSSEYRGTDYKLNVEIKSVNHRYGDITIHLPKIFNTVEDSIRQIIAQSLSRGKIDVFIAFEEHLSRKKNIRVDKDLAIAYYGAFKELSKLLQLPMPETIYEIAGRENILVLDEASLDVKLFQSDLLQTVQNALQLVKQMRQAEGKHIGEDLVKRINILENAVNAIEKRAPEIVKAYRCRLLAKLQNLIANIDVEEPRFLQEVLLFADKVDCTEEVVRLQSHFRQFRAALALTNQPIGRKLDFIVQEMNRETNTIAAKANDAIVANVTVEMKSEIEKIREQIQNIE